MTITLESRCGEVIPLPVQRWRAPASPEERALLAALPGPGPVLDVGCGPGRLVHALLARGRAALGIDLSPSAVAEAKARGALVLRRDVFAPLPGEGRWASVLLIDGNIGIGGNPERLLRRVRDLLAPGGTLVVEVEPPDHPTEVLQVRVQSPDRTGPWFPWARVSAASIGALASDGDLTATRVQRRGGRWFAWLTRS